MDEQQGHIIRDRGGHLEVVGTVEGGHNLHQEEEVCILIEREEGNSGVYMRKDVNQRRVI